MAEVFIEVSFRHGILYKERLKRKISTMKEMADLIGMPYQSYRGIERLQYNSRKYLDKIASFLDIDPIKLKDDYKHVVETVNNLKKDDLLIKSIDSECFVQIESIPENIMPRIEDTYSEPDAIISEISTMLTPRETATIVLYFGLDHKGSMSIDDIASKFNLSAGRVRQIKEKALAKLHRRGRNLLIDSLV